jgi:MoaA/NifB/PqqE/SkfB family radical SAM enzyme
MNMDRKVDLIWNTTLVCPYDCPVCCVDAVHVRRRSGQIEMRSNAGTRTIARDSKGGSIFEQAGRLRQRQGLELDLAAKMRVLDHLEGLVPRIDFSGGDLLVLAENLDVVREAARRFGRGAITITATGAGIDEEALTELPALIGHFNFTFDSAGTGPNRPRAYAASNLRTGERLARAGVAVRAELPLTRSNTSRKELTRIYERLRKSGIEQMLAMRLFPVGRGAGLQDQVPSPREYLSAIGVLRELEMRYGGPRVRLQCALRHLEPDPKAGNPCNAVKESFGIMPDGTLLRSAWALDRRGKPLDPSWVLGNVAETPLPRLLDSVPVREMVERADENFGECKVFAFLNGQSRDPAERFFERADPLYNGASPGFMAETADIGTRLG